LGVLPILQSCVIQRKILAMQYGLNLLMSMCARSTSRKATNMAAHFVRQKILLLWTLCVFPRWMEILLLQEPTFKLILTAMAVHLFLHHSNNHAIAQKIMEVVIPSLVAQMCSEQGIVLPVQSIISELDILALRVLPFVIQRVRTAEFVLFLIPVIALAQGILENSVKSRFAVLHVWTEESVWRHRLATALEVVIMEHYVISLSVIHHVRTMVSALPLMFAIVPVPSSLVQNVTERLWHRV
jgi:hypothetical protein